MALVLLFALTVGLAAAKCNPELYEAAHAASITHAAADDAAGAVPLTLLPQDKGDESPAGLDGGPFGFWFQPSTTGSTKWTISINGGVYCCDVVWTNLLCCLVADVRDCLSFVVCCRVWLRLWFCFRWLVL